MLEYQESIMVGKIKPNNTGYFSKNFIWKEIENTEGNWDISTKWQSFSFLFLSADTFPVPHLLLHSHLPIHIFECLFLTAFFKHSSWLNPTSYLSVHSSITRIIYRKCQKLTSFEIYTNMHTIWKLSHFVK